MKVQSFIETLARLVEKSGYLVWGLSIDENMGRRVCVPEGTRLFDLFKKFSKSSISGKAVLMGGLDYADSKIHSQTNLENYYRWNKPFKYTKECKSLVIESYRKKKLLHMGKATQKHSLIGNAESRAWESWDRLLKNYQLPMQTQNFYWFWECHLEEFAWSCQKSEEKLLKIKF